MRKRWITAGLATVAGGALGYAYYYFIGCTGGACPITSNPVVSTAYGMVIGLLVTFPGRKGNR